MLTFQGIYQLGVRLTQFGKPLGKNLAGAGPLATEESAYLKDEADWIAMSRKITQRPKLSALHLRGGGSTTGACSR